MRKNKSLPLTLSGKIWIYPGESASWHFFTVPQKESAGIRNTYGPLARGWGSFPVQVALGETVWTTSIFPDRSSGTYLLPLKAAVRKKEGVFDGDTITVQITILVDG
ncbi:DUF1905 domain-containing protein [Candidatus Kaiserbacteria bacterium]|nr:DUF1905 domain-containing protein [Candidatus Kaiserbacteria bacterium]